MGLGKNAVERIEDGLKRYRSILANARKRDVSESDTVVIIGDMLADVLGYEKYEEISTEFAVKGTYVDLAVRVGKEIYFLVEAKAIGVELKDIHVRQVVDYGANQGVEWAVVTNGAVWRVYKIEFKKPINHVLIAEVDLLATTSKDAAAIEFFTNLCKEGFAKSQMEEFYEQHQATNKHTLAAVLLSEPMLNQIRLGLRRIFPNVEADAQSLATALRNEVLKRELIDGEDAEAAAALVKRMSRAAARRKASKTLLIAPSAAPSASVQTTPAPPSAAASKP
jgi:predicted type IV restriction endonuclease